MIGKEELEKINQKSIMDYIKQRGYTLQKEGQEYEVKEVVGGLKIDPQKNSWYWFGKDKGGGIIQLVMELEQKKWLEAVHILQQGQIPFAKPAIKQRKDVPKELIVPEKAKNYHRLFAYLNQTRKIPADVIQAHLETKNLYQSEKGSVVFLGKDEKEEIQYVYNKSTSTTNSFVYESEGSHKEYTYKIGQGKNLFVFESPIDLMSFQALHTNRLHGDYCSHAYLSLSGTSLRALNQYLKTHDEVETIYVGTDHDKYGELCYQKIKEEYQMAYVVKRIRPHAKDFNKDLQEQQERKAQEEEWEQ